MILHVYYRIAERLTFRCDILQQTLCKLVVHQTLWRVTIDKWSKQWFNAEGEI